MNETTTVDTAAIRQWADVAAILPTARETIAELCDEVDRLRAAVHSSRGRLDISAQVIRAQSADLARVRAVVADFQGPLWRDAVRRAIDGSETMAVPAPCDEVDRLQADLNAAHKTLTRVRLAHLGCRANQCPTIRAIDETP